jgi:hypothetical protein
MISRVANLRAVNGLFDVDPSLDGEGQPDFIIAFLPPGDRFPAAIQHLAAQWPSTLRFGCEAVTQFAESRLTRDGALHLFWLTDKENRPEVVVLDAADQSTPLAVKVRALSESLAPDTPLFLLSDGLRFPVQPLLSELRSQLGPSMPKIVGGLASQPEPVTQPGARVFLGDTVYPAACLAVILRGIEMTVEIVRGWDPASPLYTVTHASENILYEIDGRPATEWYRHFFTTAEGLAPMPLTAYRFPLIIEGPLPERMGLYRSMRFFDAPAGAVTFWGDLQNGDQIRLGMGDGGSLIRTAARLSAKTDPEAAILYSCVGRELVLGDMAEKEAATIHEVLGGIALTGFFSFGEIGPTSLGSLAYYNQTAVLALLREKRAGDTP